VYTNKRRLRLAAALVVVTIIAPLIQPSYSAFAATKSNAVTTNCGADQLEVGLAFGPGATGNASDVVLITNVGKRSCHLEGYPHLGFLTATLAPQVKLSHSPYMFKDVHPTRVQLNPGRVASFGIGYGLNYNPKSDAPKKCLVTSTVLTLGVHKYEIPFELDVCRSDMIVAVTTIQLGGYPAPFNGG
jgi:Protein of unknown function (DUF4232)